MMEFLTTKIIAVQYFITAVKSWVFLKIDISSEMILRIRVGVESVNSPHHFNNLFSNVRIFLCILEICTKASERKLYVWADKTLIYC